MKAPAESGARLLRAQGLSAACGGRPVLHAVDLTLSRGWTAVVGPNGAGKSTLLRTLAGLLRPSQGHVELLGRALPDWPARERAKTLAWCAQSGQAGSQGMALDDAAGAELSVRELVMLGRLPHQGLLGAANAQDEAAVDAALRLFDCTALQANQLSRLSGGERQRALLARAWAVQAQVLLLDEPSTHLDPPHQMALLRLLRATGLTEVPTEVRTEVHPEGSLSGPAAGHPAGRAAGREQAVLTVLHDLQLALQARRVLVMAQGRIVADGAPSDPALQRALEQVFDQAISVQPLSGTWAVMPAARYGAERQ